MVDTLLDLIPYLCLFVIAELFVALVLGRILKGTHKYYPKPEEYFASKAKGAAVDCLGYPGRNWRYFGNGRKGKY